MNKVAVRLGFLPFDYIRNNTGSRNGVNLELKICPKIHNSLFLLYTLYIVDFCAVVGLIDEYALLINFIQQEALLKFSKNS